MCACAREPKTITQRAIFDFIFDLETSSLIKYYSFLSCFRSSALSCHRINLLSAKRQQTDEKEMRLRPRAILAVLPFQRCN